MHSTHADPLPPQKGWPLWALAAVAPVVLALGFVGGMAIAIYTPHSGRNVAAANSVPSAGAPTPATSTQNTTTPAPSSRYTPNIHDFRRNGDPQDGTLPMPGPNTGNAAAEPANESPKDIREARQELARAFGKYQTSVGTIAIDYQQMRNAGTSISLVGIIRTQDYSAWAAAEQEDPEKLKAWLESAAKRVQAAALRDRFWLSWAVVEVLPSEPGGFASFEVTPLSNGSYLVTRPLASTVDPSGTAISLRAPVGESPEADRKLIGNSPWATYGPAIRFDSTDLYRPAGLADTRPR